MDLKSKHWVETLAERVLAEKHEPFVVSSGVSTSGPAHLGTLCEFLYPAAVHAHLSAGHECEFYAVMDILDSFDNIPDSLRQFSSALEPHLGKPLSAVPDPFGCCDSYGAHFANELASLMQQFDAHPRVLRADELYAQGRYDKYAQLFIENLETTKKIIEETSGRQAGADWSPVMPVCGQCGRIATTAVHSHDGGEISYSCTRETAHAKGCGYCGATRIGEHRYKLLWRLDWPSRQDFLRVSIEGGGVDHFTRGGSWDTAQAVHRVLFKREPPIGFKYGFVLMKGKKYSKSAGAGMPLKQIVALLPPKILKYALLRPDLAENKEIEPTGANLLRLFDEYTQTATLRGELSRAEHKKIMALQLAGAPEWSASLSDIILYYQVYRDWGVVARKSGDERGVRYLKPYVEGWLASGAVPDEYYFEIRPSRVEQNAGAIKEFAQRLSAGMDSVAVHNLVFDVAKQANVLPAELFKSLYLSLLGKERGPRIGKLVEAYGVGKIKDMLLKLYP